MTKDEALQEMADILISGLVLKLQRANTSLLANKATVYEDNFYERGLSEDRGYYSWGEGINGQYYATSVLINSKKYDINLEDDIKPFTQHIQKQMDETLNQKTPPKYTTLEALYAAISHFE